MKVCVLGSGSAGNCIFVSANGTKILIDLGLTATRVEKSLRVLGESAEDITVLVTHCHTDHTSGIETFCRRHPSTKVYCHSDCAVGVCGKSRVDKIVPMSGDFFVGAITVSPFKVSHDVPCVGYCLLCEGKKVTVATDIGKMTEKILSVIGDSDLIVLESNHDEKLLMNNEVYPLTLKKRILSDKGHLSNRTCADSVKTLALSGVRQFVLAHLSKENNYPELAFETTKEKLLEIGLKEGDDFILEVAAQDKMSSLFEII